jgi:L-ribulose-5-phosphate 3-epimerase
MELNRRKFLGAAAAASVARAGVGGVKIGVMDGITGKASDPASVEIAKRLGFQGLQVTLGKAASDGHLKLMDASLQAHFLEASKSHKLPLVSTYIDMLHVSCLKADPAAVKWGVEGIEITKKMGAKILMLVFFGKCALSSRAEMDAVVAPLKELSAEAERAGVILGFENTIPAEDDIRILDAVGSKSLKIYYDIGNATNLYNVDAANEIHLLGRNRICQFHFKDKGYLGTGKVDVHACLESIRDIEFEGYIVLETSAPAKEIEGDLSRNLDYLRKVMKSIR